MVDTGNQCPSQKLPQSIRVPGGESVTLKWRKEKDKKPLLVLQKGKRQLMQLPGSVSEHSDALLFMQELLQAMEKGLEESDLCLKKPFS